MEGSVEIRPGRERPHLLDTGDAILFEADVPHSYRNTGETVARIIWVNTPQVH